MKTLAHYRFYILAAVLAAGLFVFAPQDAKAVWVSAFQSNNGTTLFYGGTTGIWWGCPDADQVNLFDYFPGYGAGAYSSSPGAYGHGWGATGLVNTWPLYQTKTWYIVCQDNQFTGYAYATSWGLTITIYPQYCENGLHFQTYSPYSCGCPAGEVQPYAGSTYCVYAPPPTPSLAAAAYSVPYNTSTAIYAYLTPSAYGWTQCYLYGGVYGSGTSIYTNTGTHSSGPITSPTSFYAACNDAQWGWYSTNTITLYVTPPSVSVSASPTTVNYGQSSTVTWSSSGADSCTLYNPSSAAVATGTSGNYATPALTSGSNTYTVTCSNNGGSSSVATVITVNPPVVSMTACNAAGECTSPWVNPGKRAYLTYSAQSVGACSIVALPGGTIYTNTSGTSAQTPPLTGDTTYTFSCTGAPAPSPIVRTVVTTPACVGVSGVPVTGWAWSEYAGWLSLDCVTAYAALNWPASYDTRNWGLSIAEDGLVTGYAWNDLMGWVKFGGLSGFPSGINTQSTNATAVGSGSTASLVGWARACAGTLGGDCSSMTDASASGWDGWISLAGSTTDSGTYSTSFASNPTYLPQISGAWTGPNTGFGWLAFNFNTLPPPSCTLTADSFAIGSSTTIYYSSNYANSATFNQGLGSVAPNTSGTKTTPVVLEPTLYTLSLTGFGGAAGCNVLAFPGSGLEAYGCLSLNSGTCTPPQRQVRVSPGAVVSVYWNVQNVSECNVVGDNGQSWLAQASQGLVSSNPISARTTFRLTCDGAPVDEAVVVLVPRFQEN